MGGKAHGEGARAVGTGQRALQTEAEKCRDPGLSRNFPSKSLRVFKKSKILPLLPSLLPLFPFMPCSIHFGITGCLDVSQIPSNIPLFKTTTLFVFSAWNVLSHDLQAHLIPDTLWSLLHGGAFWRAFTRDTGALTVCFILMGLCTYLSRVGIFQSCSFPAISVSSRVSVGPYFRQLSHQMLCLESAHCQEIPSSLSFGDILWAIVLQCPLTDGVRIL